MRGQPRPSRRMKPPTCSPTGSRKAPYIRHRMGHPPFTTIDGCRWFSTGLNQRLYLIEQRDITFLQITYIRRPVILLRIDIQMVITRPLHITCQVIIPYSLQIGR